MKIKKFILFICLHLAALTALLLYFDSPRLVDKHYQQVCFFVYVASTLLYYLILKKDFKKNPLSFNNIFLFSYFIVFFQVVLLQHFNYYLPTWSYNKYWANPEIENLAVSLSAFSIILFMLGNIYAKLFRRMNYKKADIFQQVSSVRFLSAIAYVSYIGFFLTSGSYRSGVYYAGDSLAVSTYFLKLFNASLSAAIIVRLTYIYNNYSEISFFNYLREIKLSTLLLLGWHLGFSLYVGDRGVIISYGLLLGSVYIYKFRTIKLVELVILIVSASIILSVIGQVRQSKDYVEQLQTSFSDSSTPSRWYGERVPGDSFIELAHSGRTLNHALENVPSNYDYRYGVFAFKRVLGVIPGAQGILNSLIDDGEVKYISTSEFISFLIQGDNPTYGDGTSITADLYLDFGLIGMFLGMFIFGYYIGGCELFIYRETLSSLSFSWVAFLIYFSKSLYLSRGSIFLELSGIFLIWLFIYFNYFFFIKFRKTI